MIAVIVFAFIICAAQTYMLKRRNQIYILRMLGAARSSIIGIYMRRFFKVWMLTCLAATPLGIAAVFALSKMSGIIEFAVSWTSVLRLIIIELTALLVGTLVPMLTTLHLDTGEEKVGVPILRSRCIRGKSPGTIRAYISAHSKQTALLLLLTLSACLGIHLVFFAAYKNYTQNIHNTDMTSADFFWSCNDDNGMGAESVNYLRMTEGVDAVDCAVAAYSTEIIWQGIENSKYISVCKNNFATVFPELENNETSWTVYGLDSYSDWAAWLLSQVDSIQTDDFRNSNTVIICLPAIESNGTDGYSIFTGGDHHSFGTSLLYDNTLEFGSVVNMKLNDKTYDVAVGGIVQYYVENNKYSQRVCTMGTAFISRETFLRLTQEKDCNYNQVSVYLSDSADGELTSKLISRVNAGSMTGENRFEEKSVRRSEFNSYLIFCCTLGFLIAGIYIMLVFCFVQSIVSQEEEKLMILLNLGGGPGKITNRVTLGILVINAICTAIVAIFFQLELYIPTVKHLLMYQNMPLLFSLAKSININGSKFPWLIYGVVFLIIIAAPVMIWRMLLKIKLKDIDDLAGQV